MPALKSSQFDNKVMLQQTFELRLNIHFQIVNSNVLRYFDVPIMSRGKITRCLPELLPWRQHTDADLYRAFRATEAALFMSPASLPAAPQEIPRRVQECSRAT